MWIRSLILVMMTMAWLPCKVFGQLNENVNTASNVGYLSDIEKEVIAELNLVRLNPKKYSDQFIKPLIELFENKLFHYPGQIPILTNEGGNAVVECVRVLKDAKAVGRLYPNAGLSKATDELVAYQSKNGKVGHLGKAKSTPVDRIENYGIWEGRIAENISYGSHDARQIVIALLVDDGVPERGHRANILNIDFNLVGVSVGKHSKYGTMCVMDFAGGFKSK